MVVDLGREPGGHRADARDLHPRAGPAVPGKEAAMSAKTDRPMWTWRVRDAAVRAFPPERLLPDRQPVYVASWIYAFGVLTIAAFIVVLISGAWLVLEGPTWWHTSKVGLFANSLHLWSTELFFFFMVIHLWGKFWMAAWRSRTSPPSGSPPKARTASTPPEWAPSSTCSTSARYSCGTSCCCHWSSASWSSSTCCWCESTAWSRPLPQEGRWTSTPARGSQTPATARSSKETRNERQHDHRIPRAGCQGRAHGGLDRRLAPLRPGQGVRHRACGGVAAHGGACGGVLLTRRPAGHHRPLGRRRPQGLPDGGRQRTGPLQRDRRLRAALHQHPRRRPKDRADLPAVHPGDAHPHRHRHPVRPGPTGTADTQRPHPGAGAGPVPVGIAIPAESMDRCLHQGPGPGELHRWQAGAAGWRLRPGPHHAVRPARPGTQRRP